MANSDVREKLRMGRQKPLKGLFPIIFIFSALYFVHQQFPFVLEALTGKFKFLEGFQPKTLNIAVIECPGGTDKGPDGHRKDSKYLVDALNKYGSNALLFQYTDETFDSVFNGIVKRHGAHAYVSRVDPGEYEACDEDKYHEFLYKLIDAGVLPYNSPKDMMNLGSKKSLLNLAGMYYFPNSTYVYASLDQFDAFFPKTLKLHGSRVIKQNRGSKGEGVWWVEHMKNDKDASTLTLSPFKTNSIVSRLLKMFTFSASEQALLKLRSPVPDFYSNLLPEFTLLESNLTETESETCEDGSNFPDMNIRLVEARDNHEEFMTLLEFRNRVVKGYLNTSQDFVVDMEYLPRIAEGEVRLILSGKEVLYIVNKQPQAANTSNTFSANLGAGATHNWEDPKKWSHVVEPFKKSLNKMLRRMKVDRAPILWTVDFIRYGELNEETLKFVISEINASCVGFSANPEMGEVIAKILVDQLKEELGITIE